MKGIYKFTNKINNKVYIGQSQNLEERYKAHKRN
jgi:predicted GIY-YIG superfamily endonuclease